MVERDDSGLWPYAAYRVGLASWSWVAWSCAAAARGPGRSRRGGKWAADAPGRSRRHAGCRNRRLRQDDADDVPWTSCAQRADERRLRPRGVSQSTADGGRGAGRRARGSGATRAARRSPGHYANVVNLDDSTGIAVTTDGVGTKLLVAEQLGRWNTVGIDCVAMNVNDVICVGAAPLAMVDYLAVDRADPAIAEQIGVGLAAGAERAGVEIVGGELAQLGELIRGLDLAGACFGVVALDSIITGSAIEPGDAVIGLPSGLHRTATRSPARPWRACRWTTIASAVPSATCC